MSWTDKQKQIFVRACMQAGIGEEHRKLILRQCGGRAVLPTGRVTSTSPRLNQSDFEQCMATVESFAGGQAKLAGNNGRAYEPGYWQRKAADDLQRMRMLAIRIANTLSLPGLNGEPPLLFADGAGLRGWIRTRVTDGRTDDIQELDGRELYRLIEGLKAFAAQHGRRLDAPPRNDRPTPVA